MWFVVALSMVDDAMVRCDAPKTWVGVRGGWITLVGIVTMLLALGTTVTVAMVAGVGCVAAWYGVGRRHPWVVAQIASRAKHRALSDGRERRARSLAAVRDHELADLTALVDETLRNDADAGDRYDLEALLDRYAELELARAQTQAMLERFDRGVLARQLDAMTRAGKRTRRDLLARRLAHIDACRDRLAAMDDDVDEIRELICLLAQQASTATSDAIGDSDDIERRVMMLEGADDVSIVLFHAGRLRETAS